MPLTIHVPAVPHTRPTPAWSHCAFTTKTRLLPRLLKLACPGARVVWYGVAGDEVVGVDDYVGVLSDAQWAQLFGDDATAPHRFVGEHANVEHPGYQAFNARLSEAWAARVMPNDLVCFPFGHAHAAAWPSARHAVCLETGIGYPTPFLPFRVYESRAWLHYCAGKTGCEGSDYHFVAPHYYDLAEWPTDSQVTHTQRSGVVYVGRLLESKGLAVLTACADAMPDVTFTLYGQGDPTPWLRPNVVYGGVLRRDEVPGAFLHAEATLCATRYIEPFCQSHIEALLCGCPVVASDFGVFPETSRVAGGVMTARTLPQFVNALRAALRTGQDTRRCVALRARSLYSLETVATVYAAIIEQVLATRQPSGWYGEHFPTHQE